MRQEANADAKRKPKTDDKQKKSKTMEGKEVLYATQMKRDRREREREAKGEGMNPTEWDSGMRMRLPRME